MAGGAARAAALRPASPGQPQQPHAGKASARPYPRDMTMAFRLPIVRAALTAALGLLLTCSSAFSQSLTVATDSSLAPAMAAVAKAFEASRSGVAVKLVVGAPGALLEQMAQDTAIDLLAGSDAETAALGQRRRLLQPELRSVFATNTLVLVTPAALQLPVQRLSDLSRPEVVRIGIGRPTLEPAGRYAREAINAQRLWPALQRKLVQADDVREVFALVAAGDVEAGFVYATDAAAAAGRVRVVETLATTTPVRYLVHVAVAGPQPALARDFAAYLRSEPARVVWQRFGFGLP
jgi:molybdate transport system substrate-binding protein